MHILALKVTWCHPEVTLLTIVQFCLNTCIWHSVLVLFIPLYCSIDVEIHNWWPSELYIEAWMYPSCFLPRTSVDSISIQWYPSKNLKRSPLKRYITHVCGLMLGFRIAMIITRCYGRLHLLTWGKLADLSLHSLFTKTTIICETMEAIG